MPEAGWVHDPDHFTSRYAADPDPWGLERSWYEDRKRALTMGLLPEPRHRRAVEPGCANGALTVLLADRCDELIAYDPVPAARDRARARVAHLPHVQVGDGQLPGTWPDGDGDLVVLSEVAYYLSPAAMAVAADRMAAWLEPGGAVVAVHWTGETNYPVHGTAVATWLDDLPWLHRRSLLVDEAFEAGLWRREPT